MNTDQLRQAAALMQPVIINSEGNGSSFSKFSLLSSIMCIASMGNNSITRNTRVEAKLFNDAVLFKYVCGLTFMWNMATCTNLSRGVQCIQISLVVNNVVCLMQDRKQDSSEQD